MDDDLTNLEETIRYAVEALQDHYEGKRLTHALSITDTHEWLKANSWNEQEREDIIKSAQERIANASNPDYL